MRQILLDELSKADVARLKEHLSRTASPAGIEGLYWVELEPEFLDPDQTSNQVDHPFCFAVEVGDTWAKCEFLIRSRTNMNCLQTRYAGPRQISYIVDYSHRIIEELGLRT